MEIKKTKKRTALAVSALGLLGLASQTASADAVNSDQTDAAAKEASSAASDNAFTQAASDVHNEFSSAVSSSQASSSSISSQSSASSREANAPVESQKTNSGSADTASVNAGNAKTETASQSVVGKQTNAVNAAESTADKQNTVTFNVKDAFKTFKAAINKKMMMANLASVNQADQHEAKGATKTVIYGQTIDPNSLIENFSSLPEGTKVSAANLDTVKTKQGRNVVPVTVTYPGGRTDTVNAIVWVTPKGTTALAKSVSLQSNAATDKPEITVDADARVGLPYYYVGKATIDGNALTKGSLVYLGQLSEKYPEPIGSQSSVDVTDKDGDKLGTLDIVGADRSVSLVLRVESTKKYTGDIDIKFNIIDDKAYNTDMTWLDYRLMYLTWPPAHGVEPYNYSGTIVQKRWLNVPGQNDKEYTINRTVKDVKEAPVRPTTDPGASVDATYHSGVRVVPMVGYAGATSNSKDWTKKQQDLAANLYKEIWDSKGKEKPADLPAEENWHEVYQVVTNLDTLPSTFKVRLNPSGYKQAATADGKPSDQSFNYSMGGWDGVFKADNLTPQELYDQTPSGTVGVSKQENGTFLVCTNLSANDLKPQYPDLSSQLNHVPAIALNKDYDKLVKTNNDFYVNNAVPSFIDWGDATGIFEFSGLPYKKGTWRSSDVTPGHSPNSFSSYFDPGAASAGGESQLMNAAYFVDDSQNQAVIGGQHQISGKKGDTVPLELTIPSGYVLAIGQALPTSYTFTGSDSDIVIHIMPIYKSAKQTSNVHRTINYKTTDGRPAQAPKNDDLKFYGTAVTGDLSSLTNRAKQDGLTVTKEGDKTYATKQEALADLYKQAADIQGKVTKYEAEKAAYDAAKKVYDENLAKWNAAQSSSDTHTVKGISQSLSFANETDASLDVTSGSDKPVNFIKSSAWLGNGHGVYDAVNVAKSFGDSDISYSRAEGTAADGNAGQTYTGVQLKVGESVVARYTGLKNSVYVDSTGAAHKLSKVQVKYTLNSTTANDGTANVFLSNNPNIALRYGAAAGKSDGSVDFTVDLTFYDENGNPITMGKGSNAWLNMGSLNRGDNSTEYFVPNDNTAMQIPGSTIVKHDNGWYADSNNEGDSADWDKSTAANRYYGAAIMELEGKAFHIGQKIVGPRSVYSWNTLDSSLATAYKSNEPVAPAKPNIAWHEVTNTTWDGPKDFADVTSPEIKGYKVDRTVVSNKSIAHDHADIVETVTYTPDIQKLDVTYHDDTANKDLKKDEISGGSSTVAAKDGNPYTTEASINSYKSQGYELVSDDTGGKQLTFDNDSSVDQHYGVHLKHGISTKQISDDVNRTINYTMSDGSKAPAQVKDSIHFNGTQTIDNVTKAVTNTTWDANKDFTDVTSPAVKGYTPDRKVVSDKNIAHDHADIVEAVVYTPENQKGTITYVDQTTGTVLETKHIQGVSNAKSSYTTANSLKIWESHGYELVKDETGGKEIIFDIDSSADQNYTVTLKHGTKTEDTSAVVKRTIDYVVKGEKAQAPSPVNDSLTFKGTVAIDKVTGKVVKVVWSNPQDFKDVESPSIKGYKVDRTLVSDKQIAHDHPDIHEVVTYIPDTQKAKVIYVDDSNSQVLKTDDITGDTRTDSGYNTKSNVQGYLDDGYELVSDDTNGKNVVFDDDPNADQTYYVHFTHGTVTVTLNNPQTPHAPINKNPNGAKYPDGVSENDLTKTVTRTVNYVMTDGSTPPAPVKDAKTFDETLVIDKVTGQILSSTWTPSQTFDKVDSPTIDDYTPDKESVPAAVVDHTSSDIVETVTYTPIIKKVSVVFVDTVTGKTIKTKNLEGKAGQKSGYSTAGDIKELEGQGYVLVQDDTNGQELLFDDQNYTVKLIHRIDHTLDFHEAVRTVVFHLPTGDKTVKQIADVIRTINKDAVTSSVTYGDWSTNKWKALDVLTAEGYTPSQDQIAEEMVSGDTKDKTVDIYYKATAKDAQANIPAKPKAPSSAASSTPSSVASSASSAPSSVASSASQAPSSVDSQAPSSPSSVASSAASNVAVRPTSTASAKTLPQTGADELAAVAESVLGLASAIAGDGLLKKKRRKTNKKNKN